MSVKHIILIGLIVLIIGGMGAKWAFDISKIQEDFDEIKEVFGEDIARWVERIYRWETAHFSSGQFKKTYSAGMEKHAETYPYGWTFAREFWDKNPEMKPIGSVAMQENKGLQYDEEIDRFLKFRSLRAALYTLALYVQKYGPGRWYSTLPERQESYRNKLLTVKTRYT